MISVSSAFAREPQMSPQRAHTAVAAQVRTATADAGGRQGIDQSLTLPSRPAKGALPVIRAGKRSLAKKLPAPAGLPRMIGTVIAGDNWTESYTPYGLYDLPVIAGSQFTKLQDVGGRSAGHLYDGVYYNCKMYVMAAKFGADWSGYDIVTGERVFYRETYDCHYMSVSTSVDPTTDIVYGLNYTTNGQALQIVTIDYVEDDGYGYNRVDIHPVAQLEGRWAAIAFDGTGQLWGISFTGHQEGSSFTVTDSYLHKIDKATGATTQVGATGLSPQYASDMDFDVKTNRLYWTIEDLDDNGYLAEVNTATGAARKILDFPHNEEVVGLVVIPVPDPGTPDRVTDVSATFEGGSLTGTVNFRTPANNTDGNPGTGQLSYTVLGNGAVVGQGTCGYGQMVNAPVTVDNGGLYTFSVTVASGEKSSKAVKTELFVGFGTPKATEATASWADGLMTVSWTRPTETVDGGFLSPTDPFEYVVTDYDTGAVQVRVTDATSCSFAVPEPAQRTPYRYKVTGTSNGKSFTSATNVAYAGSESAPYLNDFNNDAALDGYTVIDANDDGKVWTCDGSTVKIVYNTYKAMDDWLITVPLKLEGGRQYPFSIDARCMNVQYSEKLEVKAGMAPTVEAMTIEVIPETLIDMNSMQTFSGIINTTATGLYYIGVHGMSPKDRHTLIIDNLKVDAPLPVAVPSQVQDLELVTDPTGALKASVNFTTPDKDSAGNSITSIARIDIQLGDRLVKSIPSPAVATRMSEEVTVEAMGEYTVTVTSYNDEGEGSPASVTGYIGLDVPAAPAAMTAVETAPGRVALSWEAVTADIHGTPLPASSIVYDVYQYNGGVDDICIASDVTGTSISEFDMNMVQGQQTFVQFAVYARTQQGYGEGRLSPMIPVGYASQGFVESFAGGRNSNPMMVSGISGAVNWMIMIDANGITCQDGDNGLISMIGEFTTDTGALYTGKVSLSHLTDPALRFYACNIYNPENEYPEDNNTIVVKIAEAGTSNWQTVLSTTFHALGGDVDGWFPVDIDLKDYASKEIMICVETTTASYRYSPFDNFRTYSRVPHNMHLTGITAPRRVVAGSDYTVAVSLANEGYEAAEGYSVELYLDGTLLDTKTGAAIPAEETAVIEFPLTMHTLAVDPMDFHAVVVHAPDMILDNNTSDVVTVTPAMTDVPCVTDLSGEWQDDGLRLDWSEPAYANGIPATVTDGFEDYAPWSAVPGNWLCVDNDREPVSGFLGFDIPGMTIGVSKASFIVFDGDAVPEEDRPQFAAHGGHQFMGAIQRYDDGQLDDWLISPRLSGNEQVISFYAKSFSRIFKDSFEVLYSTGGTEVSDFTPVSEVITMPQSWDFYSFDLPRGARYFAIRACGKNTFLMMVDDVTYQSGVERIPVTLTGYNIWRDGKKINAAPVTECGYVDALPAGEFHKYVVTAVYDRGESRASNMVNSDPAGIFAPTVEAEIEAVFSSSGIRYAPDAPLAPGVYMIRYTDGRIAKTVVR